MTLPEISALEHYERCIGEGNDPCEDPPLLQRYMARWDGPAFFEALGDLQAKAVLEIGVGTGRLAVQVLQRGCRTFTGIDLSPRSIARAETHLSAFANVTLRVANIEAAAPPGAYDVAYSVLTMMHIADKEAALANTVVALAPGGVLVLSVAHVEPWLDYGNRRVRLYPAAPSWYAKRLTELGCDVAPPLPLVDTWIDPEGRRSPTYGQPIATLVKAVKRRQRPGGHP